MIEDGSAAGLSLEGLQMRSAIEARLFDTAAPIRIGRFVVVERIGRGGMGTVYRAYDPRLDRAVAVKVLNHVPGATAARLELEAHAMARLNHPHVVTIHEVGDGPHGVFVAMEYVDGGTLAQWCRQHPLDEPGRWREVLELARQAAEGLAAAHAIGLVHRDLKPANMLIGSDGRLRLADFGLASIGSVEPGDSAPMIAMDRLTTVGSIVGTPAYMAPEQLEGTADARSDQFGLCATFFEAFCGTRPYPADSLDALRESFARGSPIRPSGTRVPTRILAAVERGLSVRPEDRHADVAALLRALERGARGRRGVVMGSVVVAAIVGFGIVGTRQAECELQPDGLGEAWDDARARSVRETFERSAVPSAAATFERLESHVTRTAERWREATAHACVLQRSRDPQDRVEASAMQACLLQARTTIDRTTRELAAADDAVVTRAVFVADLLADLTACDSPTSPEYASEGLVDTLHRGRLDLELARLDEAQAAFESVVTGASEAALPRILSQAHGALAELYDTREDPSRAREHAERALDAAEIADDPDLLARRWVALATVIDRHGGELEQARFMISRARRLEERGLLAPLTRADLDHKEGGVLQRHERWTEAVPYYERAAEELAREQQTFALAQAELQRGECLAMAADLEAGIAAITGAVQTLEQHLGPDHPEVAWFRLILAETHGFAQDYGTARPILDRAIAVFEAHPDFQPTLRAGARLTRASMHMAEARWADALQDIDRSIADVRALGKEPAASAHRDRARALLRLQRPAEALAAVDEAERSQPEAPEQTQLYNAWVRAQVLAALGRAAEANVTIDRVAPLRERLSQSSMSGLQAAEETARILTTLGRGPEAMKLLEAAIPHADAPGWRLRLELQSALTLQAMGDVAAAREHVGAAQAELAAGVDAPESVQAQVRSLAAQLR